MSFSSKLSLYLVGCVLMCTSCKKNRSPVEIPGFTTASGEEETQALPDTRSEEAEEPDPPGDKWEQLLDPGLSKWDQYFVPVGENNAEPPADVFSVAERDGELVLRVSGEQQAALTSLSPYADYHLSLEFMWGNRYHGSNRSGIIYHATGNYGEARGVWMKGLMFRIMRNFNGGVNALMDVRTMINADEIDAKTVRFNPEASEIAVGQRKVFRCEPSSVIDYRRGEWTTFELYVHGSSAVHFVDGHRVLELKDTVLGEKVRGSRKSEALTEGKILILSERSEFFVRNLKLRPITSLPES